jgi:Domain of unknown function (DUF4386)
MKLDIEDTGAERTRRIYARLASVFVLASIILAFSGGDIISRVAGSGTFEEIAHRIAAGERLYRVGLSLQLIAILSGALFYFALYATLKPVNSLLAQLAMILSLVDTPLGLLVRMCGFVRAQVYISAHQIRAGTIPLQPLSDLMRNIANTTENVGGIAFGMGLFLFFYLFWHSRYIPRIVSGLGVFASVIWIAMYLASLVFPEYRGAFMTICYPPGTIALVVTGFWLIVFTIKTHGDRAASRATIPAQ